ncbi:MAG: glutamate--cysteine ligase [Pseudomonadota bacterium]|nr:glutamate--cysteine ligase [Pseudomonadota bacterium]
MTNPNQNKLGNELGRQQIAVAIQFLRETNQIQTLRGIRRGIEKESLRSDNQGFLALTPHPKALGSALTHNAITTDYSESLLEFITPAYENLTDALLYLTDVHAFTYQHLGEELLWTHSMPCRLPDNELDIPIADYGTSNVGQMKTIYRRGLWRRYGRPMQTIAGIHYNFSLPENFWYSLYQFDQADQPFQDYVSCKYFGLIRNFHRYSWLLIYLFGSTPAVCKSFLTGRNDHGLDDFDEKTLYSPYATSLRMSDLGYQNDAQSGLNICYNSLDAYVSSLEAAMRTPYPDYEDIGLKNAQGEYQQLSTNILQIENEYYGSIRPKRTTISGERPSNALRNRGVEYIEMRLLDIDPFSAVGMEVTTGYFLDLFALFCLLIDSPAVSDEERDCIAKNHETVVKMGRHPEAKIQWQGQTKPLAEAGEHLLDQMQPIADMLDHAKLSQNHQQTLQLQRGKLLDVEQTPSAKVLAKMREQQQSYFAFGLEQATYHQQFFATTSLSEERELQFTRMAQESLSKQSKLEKSDSLPFDVFLKNWFK